MSDASVREALRSDAPLVVIEAPAGCGKTYQGAQYAQEIARVGGTSRLLILTHTHAACSTFAEETKNHRSRIEIRTLDSLVGAIGCAYHAGLDLPEDIPGWIRQRGEDGYSELCVKVATLLRRYPMIAASLAYRHPVVICDEHQDSSGDQHSVVMALMNQGSKVRLFADPMQKIFRDKPLVGSTPCYDWAELTRTAQAFEQLDTPHRWASGSSELGQWTLKAHQRLSAGLPIDLRSGLPASITVVVAENQTTKNLHYFLSPENRQRIDDFEKRQSSLLVLTHYSETAKSLRSFFYRRILLWEGHRRTALEKLVDSLASDRADASSLATAIVVFMKAVGKGFSASAFGDMLQAEVSKGCINGRGRKRAKIQELGRFLLAEADHRGVAKVLRRLSELRETDADFAAVKVDCYKEFCDAINLGDFESAEDGFAEITHRRIYSHPKPPTKAISTIHKAKGLECDSVIVMPCDGKTFPNKPDARCLLYVALSRAKHRLLLVVSRENPSPLLNL